MKNLHINNFYKLNDKPVYMATIAKSGCTYLKNLFYYLNNGQLSPEGDRIHANETGLPRASEANWDEVMRSPYVFIVLRSPINRFLSLYYEKIYGRGSHSMQWFRNGVGKQIGLNFSDDITLAEHQENTVKLASWVELNLSGQTGIDQDFHWKLQSQKYNMVKGFSPKILELENIDSELPDLLNEVVPNIKCAMDFVPRFNVSDKPFSYRETLTAELEKKLRQIYKADFRRLKLAQKENARSN